MSLQLLTMKLLRKSIRKIRRYTSINDETIEADPLRTGAEFQLPPIPQKEDLEKTTIKKKRPFSFMLIILVLITVITFIGVLFARNIIVAYIPETSILFDALGLHVPVTGESLIIKNVGVWREKKGFYRDLSVKGEVFNPIQNNTKCTNNKRIRNRCDW